MKNKLDTDELIERISYAMKEMSGKELAELYNREFGSGMTYLGDSQFEQESQINWSAIYEDGVCPDCREDIIAEDGGSCFNCGHVFTVPQ